VQTIHKNNDFEALNIRWHYWRVPLGHWPNSIFLWKGSKVYDHWSVFTYTCAYNAPFIVVLCYACIFWLFYQQGSVQTNHRKRELPLLFAS